MMTKERVRPYPHAPKIPDDDHHDNDDDDVDNNDDNY